MSEKVEIVAELKDLISGKFAAINKQIDAMDSKLASLGNKGIGSDKGITGQVVGANLLTSAITRAGSALVEFGKESFMAYGKSEQFLTSLTTMFHGNKEEAKALDQQLKGFAIETPFELNEIRDATKMMIAYGSTSGGVVNEMRMLGDISSGVGSSLSEVAYLYGTLRTQGRAFSKDIYQFTGRGIPIVKELAKQFGVTDSKVMKLVEDGKVGFKEVEKAMQSMTAEGGQFNNMMANQSKTLLGQTSNLADAWDQLKTAIGESQEGILKSTIAWSTNMVAELKKTVEQMNFLDKSLKGLSDKQRLGGQFAFNDDDKRDIRYYDKKTGQYTKESRRTEKGEYDLAASKRLGSGYYRYSDKSLHSTREFSFPNKMVNSQEQLNAFSSDILNRIQKTTPDNSANLKNYLLDTFRKLKIDLKAGDISTVMANSKMAVINEALKNVKGFEAMKKSTEKPDKEPKKLEEVAKKNKAVQLIVNIENLVRELTNVNQQATPLNQLTTEGTLKALTVAVNNSYAALGNLQ